VGVILRSRRRRRISQVIDSLDGEIPRFAQNDTAEHFFSNLLEAAEQCGPGGIAALRRREGLYSSHLNTWRQQRAAGELAGLEPPKRGQKPVPRNPLAGEGERLQRENARRPNRLKQAETIIDVQKKLCEMWGLPVATTDINGSDK